MKRSHLSILGVLLLSIAGAIFYYHYSQYRTPYNPTGPYGFLNITEATPWTDLPRSLQALIPPSEEPIKHSVPLEEILGGGPPKDGIPSIDKPIYESVIRADQYLKDDGLGILIERNGTARFYPYQILVWHEIVNDTFEGEPILVTYCPLCATGIVFERLVDGEAVEFGTSGKLWNSNLVMYDRKTQSLWSQAFGEAIVGSKTRETLRQLPAITVSWADFKKAYPNGEVLSRETGAIRDYTRDPYGDYYTNNDVLFPLTNTDDRLNLKEFVFGLRVEEARKAYPDAAVREAGVVNDTVGGKVVVLWLDEDLDAVRGFERMQDGRALTFEYSGANLTDLETGSVWGYDGVALSGPLAGESLIPLSLEPSFWFSWAAVFPETELFES